MVVVLGVAVILLAPQVVETVEVEAEVLVVVLEDVVIGMIQSVIHLTNNTTVEMGMGCKLVVVEMIMG